MIKSIYLRSHIWNFDFSSSLFQVANLYSNLTSIKKNAALNDINHFHFQLMEAVIACLQSPCVMKKVNYFIMKKVWKMTLLVDATSPKGTHLLPSQDTTATVYPQKKTVPVLNILLIKKVNTFYLYRPLWLKFQTNAY